MLAAALGMLGVFAAIYHPVGMAMLIEVSKARPRTLAFNGVCGNLGVALAAGISTTLAALFGWRAAFLIPALVCVAAGLAYLALVADDRAHHASKRSTVANVTLVAARRIHDVRLLRRDLACRRAHLQHRADRPAQASRRAAAERT